MAPRQMTARNKKTGEVFKFMWDSPQPPTASDVRRLQFEEATKAAPQEGGLWSKISGPMTTIGSRVGNRIANWAKRGESSAEQAPMTPMRQALASPHFGLTGEMREPEDIRRGDAQLMGFMQGAAPAAGETVDSFSSPLNLGLMAVGGTSAALAARGLKAAQAGKNFSASLEAARKLSEIEKWAGRGFAAQGVYGVGERATSEEGYNWQDLPLDVAQIAGGLAMSRGGSQRIKATKSVQPPPEPPAPVVDPAAPAATPTATPTAPTAASKAKPTESLLPKRAQSALNKLGYSPEDIAKMDLKTIDQIIANKTKNPAQAPAPAPAIPPPVSNPAASTGLSADLYSRMTEVQLKALSEIDPAAKIELEKRSVATAPTNDAPQPVEAPAPVEAPSPASAPEPPAPVEDPALAAARIRFEMEAQKLKAEARAQAEQARIKLANEEFQRRQEERLAAEAAARANQPPAPPVVPEAPSTIEPPVPEPVRPPAPAAQTAPPPVADPLAELEALRAQQPTGPAAEATKAKPGRKAKPKAEPDFLAKFKEAQDRTIAGDPEGPGLLEDLIRNYAQGRGLTVEAAAEELAGQTAKIKTQRAIKESGNGSSTGGIPPELGKINWVSVLDKIRQADPKMTANKMMEQAKALLAQGWTPEQIVRTAVKEDPAGYMMGQGAPPAQAVPDVAPPVAEPPKPRLVKKEGGALVKESGGEALTPEEIARLKAEMEGPGEVSNPAEPLKPKPRPVDAASTTPESQPVAKPQRERKTSSGRTERAFWDERLDEAEADVRAWRSEINSQKANPAFDKDSAIRELKKSEAHRDSVREQRRAAIEKADKAALERKRAGGQRGEAVNPIGMARDLVQGVRDKLTQWKEEMRGRGYSEDEIAQAVRDAAERHIREQNETSPPSREWTPELEEQRWERDNPNSSLRRTTTTTTTTNASGESAASAEAISRAKGMRARGEEYGIVEADGRFRKLLSQDDADSVRLKPGQTKIVRNANGSYTMLDGDGRGLSLFEKLEKRRQGGEAGFIRNPFARAKESQPLDAATAKALEGVPGFEDITTPETGKPKGPKPPKPKEAKSNPKWESFTTMHENWVRKRRASAVRGELAAKDFSDLDAAGSKAIIGYGRGIRGGKLKKVENLFNSMHEKLVNAGVRVGFRDDYLPQMWDHPKDEVSSASRRLGLKPRFAMKRVIENYEQGIQLGWKPKMKTVSELVRWYVGQAEKAIADREYFTYLKENELILPSSKAPSHWVTIDQFPFHKVITPGQEVVSKSWKARPEVAKMINNYLGAPEEHIHRFANFGQLTKNLALSSGIPFTAINAHGFNMVVRNALGQDGVLKGVANGLNWIVRPGEAGKWLEGNLKKAPFAMDHGLTLGIELGDRVMSKDIVAEMTEKFERPRNSRERAANVIKAGFKKAGGEKLMAAHDVAFERPLFQKVVPALKLKHFYALFDDLKKQGLDETKAAKTAAKATNELYGGIDWEAMGRNRTFQDLLRGTLLASDWAETSVRMGKGIGGLVTDPKKFNAPENQSYRNALKGLVGLYASANILNYATSGHFMWDNAPGHAFDIEMGETDVDGKKKTRWMRPYGTAADMVRLPVDVAAGIKNGDLGTGFQVIKNRLGFAPRAALDLLSNQDKQGRKIFGKDPYGKPIPRRQQAAGAFGEVADIFMPQYVGAAADLLTGRSNVEMALLRGAEMPVRYSSKPGAKGATNRYSRPTRDRRR